VGGLSRFLFPNLYISDLYISHVTCQQRWGECDERASSFLSRDDGGLDTSSPLFGLGSSVCGVRRLA
jgi:hypothetical protein